MKRREFLKGLSVAASVAAVPALAEDNKKWETVGDASVSEIHQQERFVPIPDFNPFTIGKVESFLKECGIKEFKIVENSYYVMLTLTMPIKYQDKIQSVKNWMYHNKPAPVGFKIVCDDWYFYNEE